jgi:hypothetical protein
VACDRRSPELALYLPTSKVRGGSVTDERLRCQGGMAKSRCEVGRCLRVITVALCLPQPVHAMGGIAPHRLVAVLAAPRSSGPNAQLCWFPGCRPQVLPRRCFGGHWVVIGKAGRLICTHSPHRCRVSAGLCSSSNEQSRSLEEPGQMGNEWGQPPPLVAAGGISAHSTSILALGSDFSGY